MALSLTLTALSSVITLFTIPVIMSAAASIVGESVGISLPVGNLIKQNLLLMLLPVLLGIGIHYLWPAAAEKTDKVLGKLAFPLLFIDHRLLRAASQDHPGQYRCAGAVRHFTYTCSGVLFLSSVPPCED